MRTYYKSLFVLLLTAVFLFGTEIGLSGAHFLKSCFEAQCTGAENDNNKQRTTTKRAETEFPFRSPRIDRTDLEKVELVIWVASASHAEDTFYPMTLVFPNRICEFVQVDSCYTFNASRAGADIHANSDQLEKDGPKWSPDFTILYQMSLDVQRLSRTYLSNEVLFKNSSVIEDRTRTPHGRMLVRPLASFIEGTWLYRDSREFIGSSFLLQTHLEDELPDAAEQEFVQLIADFVEISEKSGARPILTTFAAAYTDAANLPYRFRTWSLVWDERLSPTGLLSTIEQYNSRLRRLAEENNIQLIDIAEKLAGKPQYFRDLVHFNEQGHRLVAELIATELSR